jgi:polar amino acid transport system substrate-binding protein
LLPYAWTLEMAKVGPNVAVFETIRNAEREPYFKWVDPLRQYSTAQYYMAELINFLQNGLWL